MKRFLTYATIMVVSIAMVAVFSTVGCAPVEEVTVDEPVEEPVVVEEVPEGPIEEEPLDPAVDEPVDEPVVDAPEYLTAAEFYGIDVPVGEVREDAPVVGYIPWIYDPADFYGVYHAGLIDGMDEYFGEGNYEMPMRIPADAEDHIGQLAIAEDMIAMDVDYIVLCPTSYEGQIEIYRNVNEADIPLFIFNYEEPFPPEWGVHAYNFSGYSHKEAGLVMVDYVAENYPEGTKMAIIYGSPIYTAFDRGSFEEHQEIGMDLIEPEFGYWDRAQAFDIAQRMVTAHPDLEIIYAVSSAMAMGALEAVATEGMLDQVNVYGAGAIEEELEAIVEGTLAGTWFRNPFEMGRETAHNIFLYHNGRANEIPLTYFVPIQMIASVDDIHEHVPPEMFTP